MARAKAQQEHKLAQNLNSKVIRAAGGVVWRRISDPHGETSIEIAVIHRPRYDDWTIPKGKLMPGESEIEGAVREVLEETGLRVRLGRPLGQVKYLKSSSAGIRPKVVRYWSMEAEGGTFVPTREVDDVRWVSPAEAMDLLTFERDKQLVEKLVRGPALTGSVLLVRHGSAGERDEWTGDDRDRPLDELGWEQAQELTRLLSRFDVDRVVSADFLRCVQTVEPFCEAVGLPLKEDSLFSECGYPGHEEEAIALLRSFVDPPHATVICSQGGVIPDLLGRLAVEDHIDLAFPPPKKKGSIWSLTFDGSRLFSAEYLSPPKVELPG